MAAATAAAGRHASLLSASKTPDPQFAVQLHPLVILTISDHIARHALRRQPGPVAGAILGAQHGREITMEVAFECKLNVTADGGATLDAEWFEKRLQHFREVYKSPALDLVGWFTTGDASGPRRYHLPVHQHLLDLYNDAALLLLFHPEVVDDASSKGGKLPLSIYESTYEVAVADGDGDEVMPEQGNAARLALRFVDVPYTIETGEAEMIGVDSVANGGTNAATTAEDAPAVDATRIKASRNGKGRAQIEGDPSKIAADTASPSDTLSPEEEAHIQSLTAKANAVRMLQQRVALIKSYLQSLPPCYLTTPASVGDRPPDAGSVQQIDTTQELPHAVLRQARALLARLPLLDPTAGRGAELDAQAADVALASLLGASGAAAGAAHAMGRKAHLYESGKGAARDKGGRGTGADGPSLGVGAGGDSQNSGGASGDYDADEGFYGGGGDVGGGGDSGTHVRSLQHEEEDGDDGGGVELMDERWADADE